MFDKKEVVENDSRYDENILISHRVQQEVFGDEEGHDIHYRTLSWQMVAVLMITEIVSNGMLSLPSSGATVGVSISIQHG